MSRDTKIKDIEIIRSGLDNYEIEKDNFVERGTENCIPKNRDAIALYADEPCVEACQLLYDLNIQTYTSGGHVDGKENATGTAYIGIVYNTLSDENKKIAKEMIEEGIIDEIQNNEGRGTGLTISLEVPIHSDSLVGDVSDKLMQLASHFQPQDVLYGRYTYEELKEKYFGIYHDRLLDWITHEEIAEEEVEIRLREYMEDGTIPAFSEDGELYFVSEDLLKKHNSYLESKETHIVK